jgi:hypothetical protein
VGRRRLLCWGAQQRQWRISRDSYAGRHREPRLELARGTLSALAASCPQATARTSLPAPSLCWIPVGRHESLRRRMLGRTLTSASLSVVLARRSSWAAAAASRACLRPVAAEGGRRARWLCTQSSSSRARLPERRRHGPQSSIAASSLRRGGMHIHALVQNPSPIVGAQRREIKAAPMSWGVVVQSQATRIDNSRTRPPSIKCDPGQW